MAGKKRGLGRGLDALLGSESRAPEPTGEAKLQDVPVEWIKPGKYQPRQTFDQDKIDELAASIKAQGLMQPIVLRLLAPEKYEIVAGERRWRAAQKAGLGVIPAIIREVSDESAVAMSLIENIQREDLNPLEESRALHRLIDEFDLTHQQIAEAVGKSRTAVTNTLRLMNLNPAVARMLASGDIEMGHARALLGLDDHRQELAAREIVNRQLNVRQAEMLVRQLLSDKKPIKAGKKLDTDTRHLAERLSERLGQPVNIAHSAKGKGKLTIGYGSLDELDGILDHFKGLND